MASLHQRKQVKGARAKTVDIGTLESCGGNGPGTERLAATNRMQLDFAAFDDGALGPVKIRTTLILDRTETVEVMRRCFAALRRDDCLNDVAILDDRGDTLAKLLDTARASAIVEA